MANWFKKSIDLGGYVTNIWSLLPAAAQTAATTVLSAVTAYFGYYELGIARAIFLATGVMAFGTSVVFFWARISQMMGTFQRLSVFALIVPGASVDAQKGKINGINLQCVLRNDSQMLLFYKLRRIHHAVETIGPKNRQIDQNVVVIAANGGTQTINLATIENVPFPTKNDRRVSGPIELEIEYGPALDELKYLLQYNAELHVVFNPVPSSKEFRIDTLGSLKLLKHSRL